MAGGKETPRQKMIGMMYLVLTALLALNVSKQVIGAFITLNDKVEVSTAAIQQKNQLTYNDFDLKKMTLKASGGKIDKIVKWQEKALNIKTLADSMVHYLINEVNDMIVLAEGTDWIEHSKDIKTSTGKIYNTKLKPLQNIQNFDNYDIPTHLFVGSDRNKPNNKGQQLRHSLMNFRNKLCETIANYKVGGKTYVFSAPNDGSDLTESFKTVNPEDTSKIRYVYQILNYKEMVTGNDGETLPWVSAMFDHAPVVAAAALFSALKSDVRNAESVMVDHLLTKVNVPIFVFNKIEPIALSKGTSFNLGDSIPINVQVAAYDSTNVAKIEYAIDGDTLNPSIWTITDGPIRLKANKVGNHTVKGNVYVNQRGEMVPKPWRFSYHVSQPIGVVAMPKMRIFYWGIANEIEGTASGFAADQIVLTGSNCRLSSKGNGKYEVFVNRNVRQAVINVIGTKEDGRQVNLGSFNYVCKPVPNPVLSLNGIKNGETVNYQKVRSATKIAALVDPSMPVTNINYHVTKGTVRVDGIPGKGTVKNNGVLDERAKQLLRMSRGKSVAVSIEYETPARVKKQSGLSFTVR